MGLTTYDELEQGSQEWLDARAGLVTASTIGRLINVGTVGAVEYHCPDCGAAPDEPCLSKASKTPKAISTFHSARHDVAAEVGAVSLSVADNETSRSLLLTLAAERISGHVEPIFVNAAMERGTEDEPFARIEYEAWAKVHVEEIGFAVREEDGVRLGCSPDGLPPRGLIEIKSRGQARQLAGILSDAPPAENLAQMHAGMWVMDRQWCDYIAYRDGMHLDVKRVHRDPAWDKAIQAAAVFAEGAIRSLVDTYNDRVEGLHFVEKRPDLIDTITF